MASAQARIGLLTLVLLSAVGQLAGQERREVPLILEVDISPKCAEQGTLIAVEHAPCWNATPVARFPAKVMSADPIAGTLSVVFGWDVAPEERWTNESAVLAASAAAYACLRSTWPDHGTPGRGYADEPSCQATHCARGCIAGSPEMCEQGAEFRTGENCTVVCPGSMVTSTVNITCDVEAPVEERMAWCAEPIVYCDDLLLELYNISVFPSDPNASDLDASIYETYNVSDLGCTIRQTSTTTTTIELTTDSDRYLRGCSELQELRGGVMSPDTAVPPVAIGMPQVTLTTGTVYFEVVLEGPWEQVGFVDSQWLSDLSDGGDTGRAFLSEPGGPGIVGAAVRVVGRGLAEFWFSRDGVWQRGRREPAIRETTFTPPLVPAAFVRGRSTWVLRYDDWVYDPPSVRYMPLTRREYPPVCRFPLDFVPFAMPPNCPMGFESIWNDKDCGSAAFHIGYGDWSATAGEFEGWPPGCFYCDACDAGHLFLNLAHMPALANGTGLGSGNTFEYSANTTAAICRRIDPDRTTTLTTTTYTGGTTTMTLMPPLYMRSSSGVCVSGYFSISTVDECQEASAALGLLDTIITNVSLSSGLIYWPPGCFYCFGCDSGQLFWNENPDAVGSAPQPGDIIQGEPLCKASAEILTTGPPTTTAAGGASEATTEAPEETTTLRLYTTTTLDGVTPPPDDVDLSDFLTCDDPFVFELDENWWERIEVAIAGGGLLLICCCCCCCCCCFLGGCEILKDMYFAWLDRHPRLKQSCCCRGCFCCGRCLWRFCPCLRVLGRLSAGSPRSPRSPRQRKKSDVEEGKGALGRSSRRTSDDEGSKISQRSHSRLGSGSQVFGDQPERSGASKLPRRASGASLQEAEGEAGSRRASTSKLSRRASSAVLEEGEGEAGSRRRGRSQPSRRASSSALEDAREQKDGEGAGAGGAKAARRGRLNRQRSTIKTTGPKDSDDSGSGSSGESKGASPAAAFASRAKQLSHSRSFGAANGAAGSGARAKQLSRSRSTFHSGEGESRGGRGGGGKRRGAVVASRVSAVGRDTSGPGDDGSASSRSSSRSSSSSASSGGRAGAKATAKGKAKARAKAEAEAKDSSSSSGSGGDSEDSSRA